MFDAEERRLCTQGDVPQDPLHDVPRVFRKHPLVLVPTVGRAAVGLLTLAAVGILLSWVIEWLLPAYWLFALAIGCALLFDTLFELYLWHGFRVVIAAQSVTVYEIKLALLGFERVRRVYLLHNSSLSLYQSDLLRLLDCTNVVLLHQNREQRFPLLTPDPSTRRAA